MWVLTLPFGGEILAETDLSGNTLNEYIFFGGKRVAMLPAGGNPIYYAEDLLGSSRVITQNNGAVCYDADFDPFGGEHAYTNTCSQNYKFEGKERDTETGNDDFGARYYTSRFGRWLSADWSSVPVPVPYANLDGHAGQSASQGLGDAQSANNQRVVCNQNGDSGAGCDSQAPNLAESDQPSGHAGLLGLTRDWLDAIGVSGSYGLGTSAQGQAGEVEGHAGVGGQVEGTIGLGGGNKDVEVFGGGQASGRLGPAEGEVKAGISLSPKDGASLSGEARGAIGSTGAGVKVNRSGVHFSVGSQKMGDTKIGAHIQIGIGVGVNINFSQAARAFERSEKSAGALAGWIGDKLESYGAMLSNGLTPNFGPHPN